MRLFGDYRLLESSLLGLLFMDEHKIKDRSGKLEKKKQQMKINGRGLKSIILPLLGKKAKEG